MQGGIRRKKDLLPRYKSSNGKSGRGRAMMTTPMKKTLAYVTALFLIFLMLRIGYSGTEDLSKVELDHGNSKSSIGSFVDTDLSSIQNDAVGKDGINKANADVNSNANADRKGNLKVKADVGADIDANANSNSDGLANSNTNVNGNSNLNADSKKKVGKEQFNNEVAKQQEVKNLEKEYQKLSRNQLNNENKNKVDI